MKNEIYHSSGVNRSPGCMSVINESFIYASCNGVVRGKIFETKLQVIEAVSGGHTDRVNCVRWIDINHFVTGSTDTTCIVWKNGGESGKFEIWRILKGHSASVTSIDSAIFEDDNGNRRFWIVSSSGDSDVKIWEISDDNDDVIVIQKIPIFPGYAMEAKIGVISGIPILIYGRDDSKVCIHLWNQDKKSFSPDPDHVLRGHEDWVRSIDIVPDPKVEGDSVIATSSQDSTIRVWRLSPRKSLTENNNDEEIKIREDIISTSNGVCFAISLETILCGHEDKVYGIQWSRGKNLELLSCSLDKTMILWSASEVWEESVRVGEVGGGNLGFLGCQMVDNERLLAYSFNGSIHFWTFQDGWKPGIVVGGHRASVEDIDWDRDERVSVDQTTRIHAPWNESWHEFARPQVHGYDLTSVTSLPDFQFVSGSEEKIARVFEATTTFLVEGLGIVDSRSQEVRHASASVPSLGLSNKAIDNVTEVDISNVAAERRPPVEDTLIESTLWPEIRKLYGHVFEVFRLASNVSGTILASSSKATKAEYASVILWNTRDWSISTKLKGPHTLTVTTMAFSSCSRYFLSGSRDRSWALYSVNDDETFSLMASSPNTKSKSYPHQRLIWSAGFSPDSKFFFTTSRDKKVAIWRISLNPELTAVYTASDSVTSGCFAPSIVGDNYILAVGLDDGTISLLKFEDSKSELTSISSRRCHHKTVKRLRFRSDLKLASCGGDHAVKIYDLKGEI